MHFYALGNDLILGAQQEQRLQAEQGWFEKLISHGPSVGSFYEDALRALLADELPARHKVGTGFVLDPVTRKHSRQVDVLVYDDSHAPPFYRRGEFVVVGPQSVVSLSEVKKTLVLADVRRVIETTVSTYCGQHRDEPPGCQRLNVFAYTSRATTSRIVEVVVESLSRHLSQFELSNGDGRRGWIAMHALLLPQFFFFDREVRIQTRLRARKGDPLFDLIVQESSTSGKSGLPDYLQAVAGVPPDSTESDDYNLKTLPFENYEPEVVLPKPANLVYEASMLDLAKKFPTETEALRTFRVRGRRPWAAIIPSGLDLASVSTFGALKQSQGVGWRLLDDPAPLNV